jgi:hypothetical protein
MSPGTCGFTVTAPLYFVSFFVLSNYIMMNLIVAIVLDNYDLNRNLSTCIVNLRHDESFRKNWKIFDGDGDGMIPAHNLHALIMKTLYPLGLGNEPERGCRSGRCERRRGRSSSSLSCRATSQRGKSRSRRR